VSLLGVQRVLLWSPFTPVISRLWGRFQAQLGSSFRSFGVSREPATMRRARGGTTASALLGHLSLHRLLMGERGRGDGWRSCSAPVACLLSPCAELELGPRVEDGGPSAQHAPSGYRRSDGRSGEQCRARVLTYFGPTPPDALASSLTQSVSVAKPVRAGPPLATLWMDCDADAATAYVIRLGRLN
jgi:hypothetical protein